MTAVDLAMTPAVTSAHRRARWLSYAYALLVGCALGHFLLGIPVQFTDSFGNMLKLSASWGDLLRGEFTQHGYLRPMLWADLKLVYDLSGGDYFTWFRGAHVAQILVLVLLYVALVRPRTLLDAAVLPLGLAVLFGMHTFAGTIREAFPINTFMTVLLFCFSAALLALAPYRWWNDVLAMLLFVTAALTVETGLLVWVICVGAALVGARGISRVGIFGLVALLAAYFYVRFALLGVGSPGLVERSSGFGFSVLDPSELVDKFGSNPFWFYVYNVLTSAMSVLVSEPTAGVFRVVSAITRGSVGLSTVLNLVATMSVTLAIGVFVWHRRQVWLSRRFERDDQLVALFGMVLIANAVISYPYTKDVIMSPAGAFFAVAGCVAVRSILSWLPDAVTPRVAMLAVAGTALVSGTWAVRLVGTHLNLRTAAYVERNEWVYAEGSLGKAGIALSEAEADLLRRLRDEAIMHHPPPPPIAPPPWPAAGTGMNVRLPLALAWALLAPLGLATLGIVWVAAGERVGATPFAGLVPRNSAEAAALGSAGELLRFLRRGEDPHAVYPMDPAVASSAIARATTLEAALWSRQLEMIQLLEREGAIRSDDRRALACLAADLRIEDVMEYLAPEGVEACQPGSALARVAARTSNAGGER